MDISNPWNPTILILGSGGRKGYLTLGLLLLLKNTKILDHIKTIVGVSVGAVIGLLYIIGCNITEIIEISLSVTPSQMFDNIDVKTITSSFGLFSHDLFRDTINQKMIKYFGFKPTLNQLYYMTGIKFTVGVVNLTDYKEEYLSYETDPDLLATEAVIMSMNVPFVFQKYKYNNKLYIDGGVLNTLPIQLFDDGNTDILAINLSEEKNKDPDESIFIYISKIISLVISNNTKKLLDEKSDRCKIIYLIENIKKSGTIDPVGLKLSFEDKSQMIIHGYMIGLKFLDDLSSQYGNIYYKENTEILNINYFNNKL
jgi:NTE family protein